MKERHWNRRINRAMFILRSLLSKKRWRQFLQLVLLGLVIANLYTEIAVAVQPSTTTPAAQVQQAADRYQLGQISEASTLWQQAADRYEQDGDRRNQALVLSFLATAFEDLGRQTQAQSAIDQAILLLNAKNTVSNAEDSHVFAQVLIIQGKLRLAQGKATEALESWQQAEAIYRKADDVNGVMGSQIDQARALQASGLYRRATTLLTQVEQSLQHQPDSRLKVTGLRNLGKLLRLVGNLEQSRSVLQQSLAIAETLPPTPQIASDTSGIFLSLGSTTRAQGETDTALAFYQRAATIAPSLTAKTQIQLAQLSLLVESGRSAEAQRLLPQLQAQLAHLPPGRLAVYGRITLVQSLVKMRARGTEALPTQFFSVAAQELATAIQQVRMVGDPRAESYGLGTLGSLYETTQQWDNAQALTQQALRLAQTINAPDIAYQWQWQLGRLFCKGTHPCATAENVQAATAFYAEAVKTLQSLRSDLAAINPEAQFSFRESVEPVYRQFVELLLQSDTLPSQQVPSQQMPSQQNLSQAREVIEALQLAELDNFFREACTNARPVNIDQIDAQAAVIYPIILPNQFAVILSLPNQPLRYHKTSLPQADVERMLMQMRQVLRPTAFAKDWLAASQRVYNLLLRPIEAELAASGIKTLVFVPDGLLRSLPMAALHDGQQYLIEKYSVVLTPGLQLLQPQPLDHLRLQGLLAGLTQAREHFAALPNVAMEISQIKTEIPAQVLLDQAFTDRSLQQQLDSTPSPIVHLATHGQFSSNADNTFILTWDGRINVKQLDQLLRSRAGKLNPIELLVLSACQTATGDKRAALGMAGVAVRSGARSTLASLWSVSDRSTATLMIEFYHELGQPGVTKAEALRRSQVALLHQDGYTSPYYWAPFVLLGNWL